MRLAHLLWPLRLAAHPNPHTVRQTGQVTALSSATAAALPANATATPFIQLLPSTPCASGGGLSLAWTGTANDVPIPLTAANQPTLPTLLLPARSLPSARLT